MEKIEDTNLSPENEAGFDPSDALLYVEKFGFEKGFQYLLSIVHKKDIAIAEKDIAIAEKEITIAEKEAVVAEKETAITGLRTSVVELNETVDELKETIKKLERMLYGQKRERFEGDNQLVLEFGGELTPEEIKTIEDHVNNKRTETLNKERKVPESKTRIAFPKHLKVVVTIIEPEADVTGMVVIRKEVSEYLEYKPAEHFINRIERPVYAPESKEGSFLVAKVPSSVFERSKVGVGLVAQILYSKYVMHLPLDRQLKELDRQGIPINSGSIYNWAKLGIDRLEVLYDYKFERLLLKKYLQVDETYMQVLEEKEKNKDKGNKSTKTQGCFWVYNDPLTKSAVFKYEQGRGAEYPNEILKNFNGYLQVDGYAGYNQLAKSDKITRLACWAHVRRKFEESLANDKELAETILVLIQKLYKIEQIARDKKYDPYERKEFRLVESLPIYNIIGKIISQKFKVTTPKSPIGKALRYAFDRWEELGNYMLDGSLEIDNNLVENAIRPIAIGRKNWLFSGTHESAQRNAIMYTFMNDCKQNNVDPYIWLVNVLEKIPSTDPSKFDTLLPENMIGFFDLVDGVS
jgi:transposase